VVFSKRYLVITFNSTVLYLLSFFLIHFLTHLMTGFSSWLVDIRTTLNYTFIDWHIRWWNWTEEMVITVFSIPAIFALLIAILCSLPFARNIRFRDFFRRLIRRLRYPTKKQRYLHRKMQRKRQIEMQVQRMNRPAEVERKLRVRKKLSWSVRLFLLWTLFHSLTYFFSGLLFAFLFHRRLGYVIWYLFNSFFFEALFSVIAFLSMVTIGFVFARQFFHSSRMYLNNLNDRNRMPFVLSQAIFPFIIGTVINTVMMAPDFDLSLILLNFSLFFLLLPLPSRALRFDNLHFDSRERPVRILWPWIIWASVLITVIYVAIKIGIPISFN